MAGNFEFPYKIRHEKNNLHIGCFQVTVANKSASADAPKHAKLPEDLNWVWAHNDRSLYELFITLDSAVQSALKATNPTNTSDWKMRWEQPTGNIGKNCGSFYVFNFDCDDKLSKCNKHIAVRANKGIDATNRVGAERTRDPYLREPSSYGFYVDNDNHCQPLPN